jgi:hypothetical protein
MLRITGRGMSSLFRKTLIRNTVPSRVWHANVALDENVVRWIGDGYRRFGEAAKPVQRIPQSAASSPGPVQGGCRVSDHANTLRRLDVALPHVRHQPITHSLCVLGVPGQFLVEQLFFVEDAENQHQQSDDENK